MYLKIGLGKVGATKAKRLHFVSLSNVSCVQRASKYGNFKKDIENADKKISMYKTTAQYIS